MQDSMFSEIFGEDDLPEFKQLVDPSIHESDLDIVPYASIQALAHSCLKPRHKRICMEQVCLTTLNLVCIAIKWTNGVLNFGAGAVDTCFNQWWVSKMSNWTLHNVKLHAVIPIFHHPTISLYKLQIVLSILYCVVQLDAHSKLQYWSGGKAKLV